MWCNGTSSLSHSVVRSCSRKQNIPRCKWEPLHKKSVSMVNVREHTGVESQECLVPQISKCAAPDYRCVESSPSSACMRRPISREFDRLLVINTALTWLHASHSYCRMLATLERRAMQLSKANPADSQPFQRDLCRASFLLSIPLQPCASRAISKIHRVKQFSQVLRMARM